jgi:hypothetical protein
MYSYDLWVFKFEFRWMCHVIILKLVEIKFIDMLFLKKNIKEINVKIFFKKFYIHIIKYLLFLYY